MLAAAFANFVKKALFASEYGFTAASSIMLAMPDTAPLPIHRDNNFDSLRVLAAAMVMLSHSWALVKRVDEPIAEITYGSLAGGPLGVWMFFTISGYLVCQSYTVRRNLFAFVEAGAADLSCVRGLHPVQPRGRRGRDDVAACRVHAPSANMGLPHEQLDI